MEEGKRRKGDERKERRKLGEILYSDEKMPHASYVRTRSYQTLAPPAAIGRPRWEGETVQNNEVWVPDRHPPCPPPTAVTNGMSLQPAIIGQDQVESCVTLFYSV